MEKFAQNSAVIRSLEPGARGELIQRREAQFVDAVIRVQARATPFRAPDRSRRLIIVAARMQRSVAIFPNDLLRLVAVGEKAVAWRR